METRTQQFAEKTPDNIVSLGQNNLSNYSYVKLSIKSLSVYVDLGATASDSATINFNFLSTDTTTGRQWEIKVTQVECGNQAA